MTTPGKDLAATRASNAMGELLKAARALKDLPDTHVIAAFKLFNDAYPEQIVWVRELFTRGGPA